MTEVTLLLSRAGATDVTCLASLAEDEFGHGAAARLHAFMSAGRDDYIAKVYSPAHIANEPEDFWKKLVLLASEHDRLRGTLPNVAWPYELVCSRAPQGSAELLSLLLGFTMRRFDGATSLRNFINGKVHRPQRTPERALAFAMELLDSIIKLHALDFVIGDFSPQNVLVTGGGTGISFVDVDSYQWTFRGHTFLGRGVSPGYASPGAIADPTGKQKAKNARLPLFRGTISAPETPEKLCTSSLPYCFEQAKPLYSAQECLMSVPPEIWTPVCLYLRATRKPQSLTSFAHLRSHFVASNA